MQRNIPSTGDSAASPLHLGQGDRTAHDLFVYKFLRAFSPKFRIWPINSVTMSICPFFAETKRTFNSWKTPAKVVITNRQFKLNVRNKSQNQLRSFGYGAHSKTANFHYKAIPSTRQPARLGVLLVKGASRCL
jgi:hypothetical protein